MQTTQYRLIGDDGIMKQYKSSSELKNMAKEKLEGKYGSAMLVSPVLKSALAIAVILPVIMLFVVPSLVIDMMQDSRINEGFYNFLLFAVTFLYSILNTVFHAGIALFFLNIACGKRHSVSDLFFGFRWQFRKSLTIAVVLVILNTLCMLPYQICRYTQPTEYVFQFTLPMLVFYVLGITVNIPLSLALSQSFYLLLDFPQYSATELMKLSFRVMKGHKKRLFYIQLSFLPLELLCIFSFYVGYLWLIPYQNMTYTLFFLDLMNPAQNQTGTNFDQFA